MNHIPRTPLAFGVFVTRPYWYWAVAAILCVAVGSTLDGIENIVLKNFIDAIGATRTAGGITLLQWVGIYVATYAASTVAWRLSGFMGMRWMTNTRAYGYEKLFAYLTHHSAHYFHNRFAGALTNKIANVTEGIDRIMQSMLWEILPLVATLIVSICISVTISLLFGLVTIAWMLVYVLVTAELVRRKRAYAIRYTENVSKMRGAMVDSATNIAAVHQSAQQDFEIAHMRTHLQVYASSGIQNWTRSEWILALGNVLQLVFLGGTLWLCVSLLERQLMTIGDVVMITGLMMQLIRHFFSLGNEMNRFTDNYSQATEGLEELMQPHEIVDAPEASNLAVHEGKVSFQNVTFAYGKQNVFDHFNLDIEPGQKVGLVGRSGAGKTSLTAILLRQYDIQDGDIVIDDQSITSITQKSLRNQIALVPQDTSLFHRTIRENIRYGRLDASDDEVLHAAKLAQADGFIMKTPKGYDTLVGERGVKLSGGQRQRIAIARAILKNAPILVLDEATSALDSESESAIQQALQQLMKGKTVLAIAHRLSTLRMMDRIIVLDKGVVVEDGNHEELIAKKGIYARLWESQVRGFIQE